MLILLYDENNVDDVLYYAKEDYNSKTKRMITEIKTIMNYKLAENLTIFTLKVICQNDKVNGGTFNVVYLREYIDPECESETFAAYETIYRNVPNKYRSKFDNEKMKMKMLKHCDWNYKDSAT